VQHLRDFGRFEMNKLDRGRQREDRILVAEEEEVLHKIENQSRTRLGILQITWEFLKL
jgi:hypothetical protein